MYLSLVDGKGFLAKMAAQPQSDNQVKFRLDLLSDQKISTTVPEVRFRLHLMFLLHLTMTQINRRTGELWLAFEVGQIGASKNNAVGTKAENWF